MNRDEAIEQINDTTWEDLNPDWIEDGDLTDRFAKSEFDDCPSCGRFENIRVVNSSGDDEMASVLCCNWQASGSCPSEAIDNWNTRAASVSRKEIVEEAFDELFSKMRLECGQWVTRERIEEIADEMVAEMENEK